MRAIVIIAALVAVASAASVSNDAKPIYLLPEWQAAHPEMTKVFLKNGVGGHIIGGSQAQQNQFPYQLAMDIIFSFGRGLCGASILSDTWALTAAHCVDMSFNAIDLIAGGLNRLDPNEAGQIRRRVSTFTMHESYNSNNFNNDIAVLQMPALVWSPSVQPIRLATGSENFAGQNAVVSGWGRTTDGGATSSVLMFVQTPVITNAACAAIYGSSAVIASTICTNGASCNGDSGGPLTIQQGGSSVQIGVVSFGAAASCTNFPSAYARTSSFAAWVTAQTGITF